MKKEPPRWKWRKDLESAPWVSLILVANSNGTWPAYRRDGPAGNGFYAIADGWPERGVDTFIGSPIAWKYMGHPRDEKKEKN